MKKNPIIIIALAFVWIAGLSILIISLTDLYPNNPFKEYRIIVGIGFLALSRLIKSTYKSIIE
tara:strand:- start:208 stop:396 length:189 start_codon:yes stop_codon:yes gene_type:complete